MLELLMTSMAAGAIAYTVTRGSIFEEVRVWVRSHSDFLGKLLSCPYCFLHWVALLFTVLTPVSEVIVTGRHWAVDFITVWFATVAIGSVVTGLIGLSTLAVKFAAAGSSASTRKA
ncbi:MAG: hypothetical protein RL326_1470 [Pseudomonadota bacterium]|jgi:hypothetical protein